MAYGVVFQKTKLPANLKWEASRPGFRAYGPTKRRAQEELQKMVPIEIRLNTIWVRSDSSFFK
jgi:hypothetical protein